MSTVDELERQVDKRLAELAPMIAEYETLQAVKASFGQGGSTGQRSARASAPRTAGAKRAAPSRRTRRKVAASRASKPAAKKPRTRREGGRRDQVLALVKKKPGVTVPELAQSLGIGNTYLYRLLPALVKDGRVRKEGRGYLPA